jgi:hypothetical protein
VGSAVGVGVGVTDGVGVTSVAPSLRISSFMEQPDRRLPMIEAEIRTAAILLRDFFMTVLLAC